ncbi:LysR family transcriptional regulator [Streptomyces cavernicola]|uniref:LysR family transcriptional regulator n=1 Tax=Streptomyces cavernicola TaxID=3043613 RepID=A0ABT6SIM0_9ACTN|nr:LysR family transcriptional regulator [Streptomyces sp. B-S-A6]MDI3408042.1 LysR family transcriptional regulator [Streptomyces sp. B-S-A6]
MRREGAAADVELRDIEIFLALAEELHFGRTAQRLHLSQARVSQSISRQERSLGGALFDRSTRTVTLTPLGRRLRDELRPGYRMIRQALAGAAAASASCSGTVRLAVMGVLPVELGALVEEFRARHPGCDVAFTEFHFSDPFARIRSGQADVQLMWAPVPEPGLRAGPVVFTEGRVLAVAEGSELASRTRVSLEDLAGRTVPDPGGRAPDEWRRAMCPDRTPGGRLIHRGPPALTFHEILALVAAGRAVCPLNSHVSRYYTYPGVVFVPIEDAPATRWTLALPDLTPPPHVRAFLDTARALGPRRIEAR